MTFGIVALSPSVYAQTWVPCPQAQDFSWKPVANEPGWWDGTPADPESHQWSAMTQITAPTQFLRPPIVQSGAHFNPQHRILFCTYTAPNTYPIFTSLNTTTLGYSHCDLPTQNHAGIWGSVCYTH